MENIGTNIKIYFEEHLLGDIDKNVWRDNISANIKRYFADNIRNYIWPNINENIHVPIKSNLEKWRIFPPI